MSVTYRQHPQYECLMPTEQVRYRQRYQWQSGEGRMPLAYDIQARPCKYHRERRINRATMQQWAPYLVEIGIYSTDDSSEGERITCDANLPLYVNMATSPLCATLYMNVSRLQMNRFKGKRRAPIRADDSDLPAIKRIVRTLIVDSWMILDANNPAHEMALLVFRTAYLALKQALRRYLKRRRQLVVNARLWAWATQQPKYRQMLALPWDVVVLVGHWILDPQRQRLQFETKHYGRRLRKPNYDVLCEQDAATYFKTAQDGVMDVGQHQWTKRQKCSPKRDVIDVYLKELYTITFADDRLRFKEAVVNRRMVIYNESH